MLNYDVSHLGKLMVPVEVLFCTFCGVLVNLGERIERDKRGKYRRENIFLSDKMPWEMLLDTFYHKQSKRCH